MSSIKLQFDSKDIVGKIKLDGSKSLSNRALIIRALCGQEFDISNICTSDDSIILQRLLSQGPHTEFDAGHAGTCYRFMTAYLAIQKGEQTLTGSERMKERPIGLLVDALRAIGADIEYLGQEGYPPLKINELKTKNYKNKVSIGGSVSSQYISALIMIAPVLPDGLSIHIEGQLVSRPYLEMTLKMMSYFGIQYSWDHNIIHIPHQSYTAKDIRIEADWSAASYYYSLASIADSADLVLEGLFEDSWQGDSAVVTIGNKFGIESTFVESGVQLRSAGKADSFVLDYDFVKVPDIAQTISVMCAANGIEGFFTGLQTLRIKETDRIEALKTELAKLGVSFYKLPAKFSAKNEYYGINGTATTEGVPAFETYKDHRMAMAFAPLSLLFPIQINKPEVVSKSYINFWKDLESLGCKVTST